MGQGKVPWTVLTDPEGNEFCVLAPSCHGALTTPRHVMCHGLGRVGLRRLGRGESLRAGGEINRLGGPGRHVAYCGRPVGR
ncbi:hypothetical protein ABT120_29710 [Nonomuraea angiospora]